MTVAFVIRATSLKTKVRAGGAVLHEGRIHLEEDELRDRMRATLTVTWLLLSLSEYTTTPATRLTFQHPFSRGVRV